MATRALLLAAYKVAVRFNLQLKSVAQTVTHFYEVESTIANVLSRGQSRSVHFRHVNFIFYAVFVLTTDKATVGFHNSMKCHIKHSFSHHTNCYSACIFTDMGQLLKLLSCKV
jgi:hypothetical protein